MMDKPQTSDAGAEAESFDRLMERLRAVVEKLEGGSLGLEESLTVFEEGVSLSRRGAAILEAAEQRVEILTRSPSGDGRAPLGGEGSLGR